MLSKIDRLVNLCREINPAWKIRIDTVCNCYRFGGKDEPIHYNIAIEIILDDRVIVREQTESFTEDNLDTIISRVLDKFSRDCQEHGSFTLKPQS